VDWFGGQTAVVTGAAHGIGRASAELLEQLGARVVAVDIDNEALESAFGDSAVARVAADVGDGRALAEVLTRRYGPIELLVNNVGIETPGDHEQRVGFPTCAELPACLAHGEDGHRLLDQVGEEQCGCAFGLCNKRPPLARGAVRELSKAFCRTAHTAADVPVPGWVTHVRADDIRRFWREMEHQAER